MLFLTVAAGQARAEETLRTLAERRDLKIGVMALDATWNTPAQKKLVESEFNAITVGSYWVRTHPARDAYDWSLTDAVVAWADGAGLGVHLHPLLYPADEHNPEWVKDADPADAPAILENHIAAAMERYRGVVDVWDVVNEAISPAPAGGYRGCWWLDALGPDYVVQAFRLARKYDPDAVLLYNEHAVERANEYQSGRWAAVQQLLTKLDEEGLVDGFGWQLHTTPGEVLGDDFALAERMQWVADRGLKNFVTELDMAIGPGDAELVRQGEAYRNIAQIWLKHNNGGWFQTWGVYDKYSWLGRDKRPLLFDETYAPKPAYHGVREALERATSADFDADGDVDGADFLRWQQGLGGERDRSDLELWKDQIDPNATEPNTPTGRFVPEPPSGLIWALSSPLVAAAAPRIHFRNTKYTAPHRHNAAHK
jgi:endo-1,4-beta-xylanase